MSGFQNIHGQAELDPDAIKINLIAQLTGAVKWTQSVQNMISSGVTHFMRSVVAEKYCQD